MPARAELPVGGRREGEVEDWVLTSWADLSGIRPGVGILRRLRGRRWPSYHRGFRRGAQVIRMIFDRASRIFTHQDAGRLGACWRWPTVPPMKKPWVGMSPWRLASRGGVQLVISGLVIWGCLQVIGGHIDLADTPMADQESTAKQVAWGLLATTGLFAAYCLIRVVVGVLDIVSPRQLIEGVVVRAESRKTGDFLPGIAQEVIYRRSSGAHQRDLYRTRWHELVLDTAIGQRTLVVKPGIANAHQPGARVVARASRILKHVSKVEKVGAGEAASLANTGP